MLEEYTMKGSCVTPNTCAQQGTAQFPTPFTTHNPTGKASWERF